MPTMKILNIVTLISFSLFIQACTGGKDSILPQNGPTMKQVYDSHFSGEPVDQKESEEARTDEEMILNTSEPGKGRDFSNKSKRLIALRRDDHAYDLTGYTRTAENEIQQIFPRLKNKTLIMYIFPHLSKRERYPIPGYSTAFTMYKQTEYALPGEVLEGY